MTMSGVILLTFSALLAAPQGVQEGRSPEADRRRRWHRLPRKEQQRLLNRLRRWKSFSPEKRREMTRRMEKLRGLSPEARKRIQERSRRLRHLPAERQAQIRRRWQVIVKDVLSTLPEAERKKVLSLPLPARRKRIEGLLRERKKIQRLKGGKFGPGLSEKLRKELRDLPPEERQRRLRQIMRDRLRKQPPQDRRRPPGRRPPGRPPRKPGPDRGPGADR